MVRRIPFGVFSRGMKERVVGWSVVETETSVRRDSEVSRGRTKWTHSKGVGTSGVSSVDKKRLLKRIGRTGDPADLQ